jgi:hypothetical protein
MQRPSISHSYGNAGKCLRRFANGLSDQFRPQQVRTFRRSRVTSMIAAQFMNQDSLPRLPARSTADTKRESRRREPSPVEPPSRIITCFQPLDPGIINEAIPAFFIGRNMEGFWVARDVKGKIGGIFLLESSALAFAKRNSGALGCATISSPERLELDLENNGNPLVEQLGRLIRLTERPRRQMAALIGKTTDAVRRRLKGLGAR